MTSQKRFSNTARSDSTERRNKQFFAAVAGILSTPRLKLHVMCKNISHINPHFNLTKKVTEHVQSTNMPLMVQRHWSLEKWEYMHITCNCATRCSLRTRWRSSVVVMSTSSCLRFLRNGDVLSAICLLMIPCRLLAVVTGFASAAWMRLWCKFECGSVLVFTNYARTRKLKN